MTKKSAFKLSSEKVEPKFNCILKPGVIHGFKSEGAYCRAYPDFINNECHVVKEVDGETVIDKLVRLDDVHLLPWSGRRDKYGEPLVTEDIVAVQTGAASKKWVVGRLMYRGGYWSIGNTEYFNSIIIDKFPMYSEHTVVKFGNIFDNPDLVNELNGVTIEVIYDDNLKPSKVKFIEGRHSCRRKTIPKWLAKYDKLLNYI